MKRSLWDNVAPTTPSACGLAIAVPLTRLDFDAHAKADSKDFIRTWMQRFEGLPAEFAWAQYQPYAALVEDVAIFGKEEGVTVCRGASLDDWIALLECCRVVTLIAHCKRAEDPLDEDQLEFGDGLHPVSCVLDAMPRGYAGTLDLSVCFSLRMAPDVKRRFPNSTVIVNKGPARLDYRLAIYRQVLRLLNTGAYSYVDAVKQVQLAVLDQAKFRSAVASGAK